MKIRNNLFRTIICAVSLILAAVMLSGCEVNVKPVEATEEEKQVVGTIDGHEVYYDELRYITLNIMDEMRETYGDNCFEAAESSAICAEELKELVLKKIASDYYALVAMADEYYVGGSESMLNNSAIVNAVAESVNETAEECGGKKDYLNTLKENHMTDRLFRFYTACEECATELIYILKNDLELIPATEEELNEALHSDRFIRTNHVFIKGRTEESLALAEKVLDELKASTSPDLDIILLKSKYDSDFTLTTTHGKYFARYTSDYGDEYEEAALKLKVGEISGIVEGIDGSEDKIEGYFVILRLPLEDDWITKHFDDFSEELILSDFNVMLAGYKEKLKFVPNDFFNSLVLSEIK